MMEKQGLTKLTEECGELIQIASKKSAYMDIDEHPDGKGSMKRRLEDEIADVNAASIKVIENLDLDADYIQKRVQEKLRKFTAWHGQED